MPVCPSMKETDGTWKKLRVFGFSETNIRDQLAHLLKQAGIHVDFCDGKLDVDLDHWTVFVRDKDGYGIRPWAAGGAGPVLCFCDSAELAGQQALIWQKLGRDGAACCSIGETALYMAFFSREGMHSILAEPYMAALPADSMTRDSETAEGRLLWFSAVFLLAAGKVSALLEGADLARHFLKEMLSGGQLE